MEKHNGLDDSQTSDELASAAALRAISGSTDRAIASLARISAESAYESARKRQRPSAAEIGSRH